MRTTKWLKVEGEQITEIHELEQPGCVAVEIEDYSTEKYRLLARGAYLLQDGLLVNNPDYVEPEEEAPEEEEQLSDQNP